MRLIRPRFSLRTLFVVVTLASIALGWIAWQRRIVQERAELIAAILKSWGDRPLWFNEPITPEPTTWDVPWYRTILGDQSYGYITLPDDCDEELARNAKRVFAGDGVFQLAVPSSETEWRYKRLD